MSDIYQEENNQLLSSFVNMRFFNQYKSSGNTETTLELIVTPYCNLGCRYCYIHNHGDQLYPHSIYNEDTVLANLVSILTFLANNNMRCKIDIFSGELFAQTVGYRVLNHMYSFYSQLRPELRPPAICIPTNYTFILDDNLSSGVFTLIEKFQQLGIRLSLSASFDGKYTENFRPLIRDIDINLKHLPRNDEYYDKAFDFIAKTGSGIHPMIYARTLPYWWDNFIWFQDMMESRNIDWRHLYLLQVRNADWTRETNLCLIDFLQKLVTYSWNKCNRDIAAFKSFLANPPYGFNILHSIMAHSRKGLACSIQTCLFVRLADLAIVPCHRLMYNGLEGGRFIVEDNKITGIEAVNPEFLITTKSTDFKSHPYCNSCSIRHLCIGGCLGSQLEVTGDPFTPIPSVCSMQFATVVGILTGLINNGIYAEVLPLFNEKKLNELEYVREYIKGKGLIN